MNLFVRERERAKGILGSYEAWKGKRPDQTLMFSWRQPKFPIFTVNYILCISPFVISFIIFKKNQNKLHLLLRACNHDYYRSWGGSECVILSLLISKFVLAVLFYFYTRLTTGAGACWLFPELKPVALLWESVFM